MASLPGTIVIGGGIIGASIAWHLARHGAQVTVYCAQPGGVATPNSFAWINASWGNPQPYFHLRRHAMAGWRRLAESVSGVTPRWNGSICYDLPPERLESFAAEHSSWGYGMERIGRAQIAALEPHIAEPPEWALKIDEEGMVEPDATARALLADAGRLGATVLEGVEVRALTARNGRVARIVTDAGAVEADEVIVAAGAATAELAASVGVLVPITASPGLLVDTKPAPPLIRHIVVAPGMEMRQASDGHIVASTSFNGVDPGEDPEATARAVYNDLASRLSDTDCLEYGSYRIGFRPMPKDGFPIVGRAPGVEGLYLAVTHSGITLAPAIGEFAAEEILNGASQRLLAPYRLSRFE
jgi:glycine/D-amino acid oxidase-like deaminating enzyme